MARDRAEAGVIALSELAAAAGCALPAGADHDVQLTGFAYRLRDVAPGTLYVAAPGVGDGIDRAGPAVERGAAAVLTEEPRTWLESAAPVLVVPDAEKALYRWAGVTLRAWAPHVVMLVGKWRNPAGAALVQTALSARFRVTLGDGAWCPGRLAVASALATMDRDAEVAVFEVAADARGAIGEQIFLALPEVVVVDDSIAEGTDALEELTEALSGGGRGDRPNPPAPFPEKEGGEGGSGGAPVVAADVDGSAVLCGRFPKKEGGEGEWGGEPVVTAGMDDPTVFRVRLPEKEGGEGEWGGAPAVAAGMDDPAVLRGPFPEMEGGEGEWGGALVVPGGLDASAGLGERSRSVIGYGMEAGVLRYAAGECTPNGTDVRYTWRETAVVGRLAVHSPRFLKSCAAAVGVGLNLGLELAESVRGLERYVPVSGAMRPLSAANGAALIDDTGVASAADAIQDLSTVAGWSGYRRRYVVLGGLPEWSEGADAELAGVLDSEWDGFVGLGDPGAAVVRCLRAAGRSAPVFFRIAHLEDALLSTVHPDDLILVVGGAEAGLDAMVRRLAGLSGDADQPAAPDSIRLGRPDRPTWVEVDVDALAHNTRLIRETAGVPLMAVLKADAYGHGAARMADVVLANGADAIAVACLSEGRDLRRAGIAQEILILGYVPPWQAREAVHERISCALYDWEMARALDRAGRDEEGRRAVVHVKVDTGLSRLGLTPEEAPEFIERLRKLENLEVRGIFTHFGSADATDLSHAHGQLRCFRDLLTALEAAGLRPPVAHAANTAAAMRLPEARLDMVRAAIGLYGLSPSPEALLPAGFRPTLAFKTTVAQVKWIAPGSRVGYGSAHTTTKPTRVAVLPVGYGDGFRRTPRNWGHVLVDGRRCPILGNVCMDQTMVDVTEVERVAPGDEVVLIGRQGDATITVGEVAANLGTIVYEVVAAIMARVPRVT